MYGYGSGYGSGYGYGSGTGTGPGTGTGRVRVGTGTGTGTGRGRVGSGYGYGSGDGYGSGSTGTGTGRGRVREGTGTGTGTGRGRVRVRVGGRCLSGGRDCVHSWRARFALGRTRSGAGVFLTAKDGTPVEWRFRSCAARGHGGKIAGTICGPAKGGITRDSSGPAKWKGEWLLDRRSLSARRRWTRTSAHRSKWGRF